jgi:hydrogenase assembly chaperone HypC/HupF
MNEQTAQTTIEWQEQEDFHCITCSDQALPARVLSVDDATALAQVDIGGNTEEVDISLVDTVAPGDTLLVHGGVALEIMLNT